MAKPRPRRFKESAAPTPFEQARDEMFQQIMRCGVIGSAPEHQAEWFDDTMKYIAERYHELAEGEVADLRTLGERFVQPPKSGQSVEADAASAA